MDLLKLYWPEILTTFGIYSALLMGLMKWLGEGIMAKIARDEQESINKRLKDLEQQNQAKVHVHKIQFEKEYQLYNDIWNDLNCVVSHAEASIKAFILNGVEFSEVIHSFNESHHGTKINILATKPFSDIDVFGLALDVLEELISLSPIHSKHLSYIDSLDGDDVRDFKANSKEAIASMSQIISKMTLLSDSIRSRCEVMRLID